MPESTVQYIQWQDSRGRRKC